MNAIADAAICQALTALLRSRTEWDEAPGLYFLYREDGAVRLSEDSIVPSFAWAERPPETLAWFAGTLEQQAPGMLAAVAPADLLGAVFLFEAWGVTAPAGDAERRAELEAYQRARKLDTHPERIEQRCAWAVTRAGRGYAAKQDRGSTEVMAERIEGNVTGLIPQSLGRIVHAISAGAN